VTREDFEQLETIASFLKDLPSLAVLSPRHGPVVSRIRRSELALFPNATALSRREWDLDDPGPSDFDLVVAGNVFMYSPRPRQWFENVLERCAYLLLLDLVRRKRAEDSELGSDGDCMRYAIGGERPRVSEFFDLGVLESQILGWRTFYGGANEYDAAPMHVIALVQGSRHAAQAWIDDAVANAVALLRRE
jgi:hypothetical protein